MLHTNITFYFSYSLNITKIQLNFYLTFFINKKCQNYTTQKKL